MCGDTERAHEPKTAARRSPRRDNSEGESAVFKKITFYVVG